MSAPKKMTRAEAERVVAEWFGRKPVKPAPVETAGAIAAATIVDMMRGGGIETFAEAVAHAIANPKEKP